jgi:hypothetical protein
MNNAVCEEAAAQKTSAPIHARCIKRPANAKCPPAASDMSLGHRPDPRPYPYLPHLRALSSYLEPVALRRSGSRGPDTTYRLANWRRWFKGEKYNKINVLIGQSYRQAHVSS